MILGKRKLYFETTILSEYIPDVFKYIIILNSIIFIEVYIYIYICL
jgi:hypothetical protein